MSFRRYVYVSAAEFGVRVWKGRKTVLDRIGIRIPISFCSEEPSGQFAGTSRFHTTWAYTELFKNATRREVEYPRRRVSCSTDNLLCPGTQELHEMHVGGCRSKVAILRLYAVEWGVKKDMLYDAQPSGR